MTDTLSDDRHPDRHSRPVVVGYLDGPAGDAALAAAATEARLRNTTVTVMHQLVGTEVPDRFGPDTARSGSKTAVMYHVLQTAQDAAPGLAHIDVRVVAKPIAEELILASKSAELVVLGITTNHAATAAAFDTVPRAVVRGSHCPVLLVGSADWTVARVVCGVDRSPESVRALHWAADEAARRGTTVLAVEVLANRRHSLNAAQQSLDSWVQRCVPPSETTVLCATYEGSTADVLLSVAAGQEALLVIGAHERSRGHRVHSVTRVVTAQTEVPVVMVPMTVDGRATHDAAATADLVPRP